MQQQTAREVVYHNPAGCKPWAPSYSVGAIQDITLACSSKQPERLFIIILLVASLGRPVRSYSGHHPGMQQQTSREVACRVQRHNEHALPNGAFTHEAHCQHETLMYI